MRCVCDGAIASVVVTGLCQGAEQCGWGVKERRSHIGKVPVAPRF